MDRFVRRRMKASWKDFSQEVYFELYYHRNNFVVICFLGPSCPKSIISPPGAVMTAHHASVYTLRPAGPDVRGAKNAAKFTEYVLKLVLDDFFRSVLLRLKRQIQRIIRICFWLLQPIIEGISNYIPLLIHIPVVILKLVIMQGSGLHKAADFTISPRSPTFLCSVGAAFVRTRQF